MNRHIAITPESDVRETPPELFNALWERFEFDLDACATHANAKCEAYFTEQGFFINGDAISPEHGLAGVWENERVWCNPPFSDIGAWVLKAWDSKAELVVMLVPATRTEQSWWHDLVEPWRDGRGSPEGCGLKLTTEFLQGRTHFLKDGAPILDPKTGRRSSPKFGCCLLIWQKI
jgi:phage N-6-adenine-methyltransferase